MTWRRLGWVLAPAGALVLAWFLVPGRAVDVEIPAGLGAADSAVILRKNGIIPSTFAFRVAAKLTGADRRLKPGLYRLRRRMWPPSLLRQLAAGSNVGIKIVVPEGFSAKQIAERLKAGDVCPAAGFLRVVSAERLEGRLFPTTYFFDPKTPSDAAAHRMLQEFKRHVEPEYEHASPKPSLTLYQTLTLASIVEREAVRTQERPMIAAVYLNRMRLRMRLEADPTVQYGLGYWKKGLTAADLRAPSPYNTYVHYGLPPGPICNPGLDSFRAALRPAETKAIYFVADNTGGHIFSASLEDHLKAKRSFKRGLRAIKARLRREEAERKAAQHSPAE